MRFIKTIRTLWIFDFEAMEFRREPLEGGVEHPYVRYEGEWQSFVDFSESPSYNHPGFMQFTVTTPDPYDCLVSHYRLEDQ